MNGNHFFRATRTVLLGMLVAQSIPLIGSVVIARLYIPAEFGSFAAWLAVVTTIAVIVTGRFEMALAIESDGEPRELAVGATFIVILLSCCAVLIMGLLAYFYSVTIRAQGSGLLILFLPSVLMTASVQTWQAWAAAEGNYQALSSLRVTQALAVVLTQIVGGFYYPSSIGLAGGYAIGSGIGIVVANHLLPVPFHIMKPAASFIIKVKGFWRKYLSFPLFALPADFINNAAASIPLFIIAGKFGSESSGFFALTMRVLGAPIGLFGAAVLDVFKRSAAIGYRDRGNCRTEYIRTFKILGLLSFLLTLGILYLAEPIFVTSFGENWRKAGQIALWLTPLFAMRFIASPLSFVFYITGKQHIDFIWQIALLLMTLAAFIIPADFDMSVKIYSIGYSMLYLIYIILSYYFSGARKP